MYISAKIRGITVISIYSTPGAVCKGWGQQLLHREYQTATGVPTVPETAVQAGASKISQLKCRILSVCLRLNVGGMVLRAAGRVDYAHH